MKADIKVGSQSLGRDSGLKLKNLSEDHRTHFKNVGLSEVFATPKDLKLFKLFKFTNDIFLYRVFFTFDEGRQNMQVMSQDYANLSQYK